MNRKDKHFTKSSGSPRYQRVERRSDRHQKDVSVVARPNAASLAPEPDRSLTARRETLVV